MSRNPTGAEVFQLAIDRAQEGLYVWLPGKVVRYDDATQEADVQPLVKVSYEDEFGDRQVEELPVIPSVPVCFPGGGGYTVTFPIAVGDNVMLVFSGASIDKWLETSQQGAVDPETYHRHALADAVAIPGLHNFKRARQSMPTDHVRIGLDGADAQSAALADTLQAFLDDVKTWATAHFHTGVTTGAGVSGPPAIPPVVGATVHPTVPNVRSSTVKVTE